MFYKQEYPIIFWVDFAPLCWLKVGITWIKDELQIRRGKPQNIELK